MQKTNIKIVQKSLLKNLQNIEDNKIDLLKAKTINNTCQALTRAVIVEIYLNKTPKLK